MRRRLRRRLGAARSEAGFTLVELLVASAMGVVVLSGVTAMVMGVMRAQPDVSKRAQNISTGRWVLERLTRELRNGVVVVKATPSEVSFRTYVRRATCGGAAASGTAPAIECKVTYSCTTTTCSRGEAPPASESTGTMTPIFSENDSSEVFSYSPSATAPTYVGITLHIADPGGAPDLTISDGASLRNATLEK
jgi:prepilin-type N-terminal cleavage/methylation domain-containing protein